MRQYAPEPRTYELMTVLSPDVPEEGIAGQLQAIAGYVTAAGGTVLGMQRDSPWGRRRLAYPIRHNGRDVRDGFYTVYHFRIAPGRVDEVERELKLNQNVIRYLLTHYTPKPEDERAMEEAQIDAEEAAAAAYAAAQAAGQGQAPAAVAQPTAMAEQTVPEGDRIPAGPPSAPAGEPPMPEVPAGPATAPAPVETATPEAAPDEAAGGPGTRGEEG